MEWQLLSLGQGWSSGVAKELGRVYSVWYMITVGLCRDDDGVIPHGIVFVFHDYAEGQSGRSTPRFAVAGWQLYILVSETIKNDGPHGLGDSST